MHFTRSIYSTLLLIVSMGIASCAEDPDFLVNTLGTPEISAIVGQDSTRSNTERSLDAENPLNESEVPPQPLEESPDAPPVENPPPVVPEIVASSESTPASETEKVVPQPPPTPEVIEEPEIPLAMKTLHGQWNPSGGQAIYSPNNQHYAFQVLEDSTININLHSEQIPFLALLDADGNKIHWSGYSIKYYSSLIQTTLKSGRYTAVLGTWNVGSAGEFDLIVVGKISELQKTHVGLPTYRIPAEWEVQPERQVIRKAYAFGVFEEGTVDIEWHGNQSEKTDQNDISFLTETLEIFDSAGQSLTSTTRSESGFSSTISMGLLLNPHLEPGSYLLLLETDVQNSKGSSTLLMTGAISEPVTTDPPKPVLPERVLAMNGHGN